MRFSMVRGFLKSIVAIICSLLVGAFAGLVAAATGTKAIVIVPGVAFVTAFVLMPYAGMYAIVTTTPINVEIAGPITVSRLAILLGALAIFVQAARREIPIPQITIWPEGTLASILFAWVAIATIAAGGGGIVGKLGPWMIFAIIFFVVLNYASTPTQLRRVFILLGVVGLLQALLVLAEAFFGFSPFKGWQEVLAQDRGGVEVRVVGTSAHPIILAGFFQVIFGVLVVLTVKSQSAFARLFWIGTIAAVSVGWWYTFARSSWIGMGAMLFVGMILATRITRNLALIGGAAALVILAIFDFDPGEILRFIENLGSVRRASRLSGVAAASESLGWRTENWAGAWNIFLQHPIFGTGIDASKAKMLANLPQGSVAHQYIPTEVPHNMYLLILAELGAITLLLFMAMWVLAFRAVFRVMRVPDFRPYAVALAAIMVGQMTTFFFNPIPREVWLTMGLSMALGRAARVSSAQVGSAAPNASLRHKAESPGSRPEMPRAYRRPVHQRRLPAPNPR